MYTACMGRCFMIYTGRKFLLKNKVLLRVIAVAFVVILIVSCICSVALAAAPAMDESLITAPAAMLLDRDTGRVLYAKNIDKQLAPASTTKLMTAVLALEHCQLTDEVTVGNEVQLSGTRMGLKPGDTVTVETLLYGMFLVSGNDAAEALGVHISGSREKFAELMNQKAQELGMENSHFVNACGKDAEGHMVTVRDMATLARYACQYDLLFTIAQIGKTTRTTVNGDKIYELENTNRLIYKGAEKEGVTLPDYTYAYATGLKTGSTPNAGKCIVATAEKDGQRLIALVFGDTSNEGVERWKMAANLFDYGFANYKNVEASSLVDAAQMRMEVPGAAVSAQEGLDGTVECVPATGNGQQLITVDRNMPEDQQVQATLTPKEGLAAPVQKGDVIGTVTYTVGEETLYTSEVTAASEVMSQEEYVSVICDQLEIIPKEIVIHRITGDAPREMLIGPMWSLNKWEVLNAIETEMRRRGSVQGCKLGKLEE